MVEQQLEEWLEEGYAHSFRTACLILGNRADAEEAVQDAYLRAWRFRALPLVGTQHPALALPGRGQRLLLEAADRNPPPRPAGL